MRRFVLLLSLAIAAVAVWLLWPARDVHPGASQDRSVSPPSPPSEAVRASSTEREAAPGVGTETEAPAFVSESEENGVVANAARDGLAILVLDANRAPFANAKLDVRWRKGWGNYGNDRGLTDARGRFATTIAEHEMIEGVTLKHPELGELASWFGFLPMANDPRTVLALVPRLEPVTIRVVDQLGAPIAGAIVTFEGRKPDALPREHVLMPASDDEARTDGDGRQPLRLPASEHVFKATAEGYLPMYSLRAVPAAGRTLALHLLDHRALHEVAVSVRGAAPKELWFDAWTRELPASLPGLEANGVEAVQMNFPYRAVAVREYSVQAPPTAWHCSAHGDGFAGGTEVGAFDTVATIELKEPPAHPMARLKCKLLLPDGQQVSGEVMVHETPDLVRGPRWSVSAVQPFVAVEPAGKVCVSAWVVQYAPVIVGPIELTAEEHELTFQFVPPLTIRGRVVDEKGKPARATVNLLRPAGALRALAPDVPEVLEWCASGDSLGSGEESEGKFWFENVGVGEHGLYAFPDGLGWPARVRVTPGDQDVVVHLGTGIDDLARIQGRVTTAGTGQPIAGVQVRWLNDAFGGHSYTDADGRYTQVVVPGRLHVEAHVRRCAVLRGDDKDFARGLVTEDLVLSPSEPLFVRVRDADGKVPDVEIRGRDEKGRELVFLDANGNFDSEAVDVGDGGKVVLYGLPVTKFTLIVRENGDDDAKKRTQTVEVPANTPREQEFAIVWAPSGEVRKQR